MIEVIKAHCKRRQQKPTACLSCQSTTYTAQIQNIAISSSSIFPTNYKYKNLMVSSQPCSQKKNTPSLPNAQSSSYFSFSHHFHIPNLHLLIPRMWKLHSPARTGTCTSISRVLTHTRRHIPSCASITTCTSVCRRIIPSPQM